MGGVGWVATGVTGGNGGLSPGFVPVTPFAAVVPLAAPTTGRPPCGRWPPPPATTGGVGGVGAALVVAAGSWVWNTVGPIVKQQMAKPGHG